MSLFVNKDDDRDKLTNEVATLQAQAEQLGADGKVDESLAALAKAEDIKKIVAQMVTTSLFLKLTSAGRNSSKLTSMHCLWRISQCNRQ